MEKFNVPKPCLQLGFLPFLCKAIVAFKIKSLGNFVTSAHEKLTLNRTDIRNETCKINSFDFFYWRLTNQMNLFEIV